MPDEAIGEAQAIEALAQRTKLLELIREAEAGLAEADRAVADARAALEAAQSADEPSIVDIRGARDVLDHALDRQEECTLRLRGLQRRLAQADDRLMDAARADMERLAAFMQAQARRIADEYGPLAERMTALLAEAKMLGNAVSNITVDGQGAGFYLGLNGIALTRDLTRHPSDIIPDVGLNRIDMSGSPHPIAWTPDEPPAMTSEVKHAVDMAEAIRAVLRQIERNAREARQQAAAGD
ncbi:MAG: hypothetical protein AB7F35_18590 [Acetobacteraceae bacterium]